MIGPIEYLEAKYGPHVETIGGRRIGQCWPALQLALMQEIAAMERDAYLERARKEQALEQALRSLPSFTEAIAGIGMPIERVSKEELRKDYP